MEFRTAHDIEFGVTRLLAAPRDVYNASIYAKQQPSRDTAHQNYVALYSSYISEFQWVFDDAVESWEADLDELIEDGATLEDAIQSKIELCAAGPAESKPLVWLIRKYWLDCEEVGNCLAPDVRVRPEVLLLQWACEDGQHQFVQLLTAMPYWPIGLDENGNWC